MSSLWRLRRTGRNGDLYNLDMANAFGSTSWETLDAQTPLLFEDPDQPFVYQRYSWAIVELPSNDQSIFVRPSCGAMMGDQYAVKSFLSGYETPSTTWNFSHIHHQPPENCLFFNCWSPAAPNDATARCDLSPSKYADDIVKLLLAACGSGIDGIFEVAEESMSSSIGLWLCMGMPKIATSLWLLWLCMALGQERRLTRCPRASSSQMLSAAWPRLASVPLSPTTAPLNLKSTRGLQQYDVPSSKGVASGLRQEFPTSCFAFTCFAMCRTVPFQAWRLLSSVVGGHRLRAGATGRRNLPTPCHLRLGPGREHFLG